MICLSEQDLSYFYNLARLENLNEIFYLENHEWITAAYLYARYDSLIDENILRKHIQDDLKIASDNSTLLHALVFTKRDINDPRLLSLASKQDSCGRTSIYYAKEEDHIDLLLPFVKNDQNLQDITRYRMKMGNYIGLDKFTNRYSFNFGEILKLACDKNLTQILIKLIPKCSSNAEKHKIYFTLAMQFPVPSHPLSRTWLEKCSQANEYFLNMIQREYWDESEKYYNVLAWILNNVNGYAYEIKTLLTNCYYYLMIAIYDNVGLSDRIRKILVEKTPMCMKRLCPTNLRTLKELCDMLKSDVFVEYFESDYSYIVAWWLFTMKCKSYNSEMTEIIESTFHHFASSFVDEISENTLLHVICLHKFSFRNYNNKHFWDWCKKVSNLEISNRVNNLGYTADELALRSPYLFEQ